MTFGTGLLIVAGLFVAMQAAGYLFFLYHFSRNKLEANAEAKKLKEIERLAGKAAADSVRSAAKELQVIPSEEVSCLSFDELKLQASYYTADEPCGLTVILLHDYRSSCPLDFGGAIPFLLESGCNVVAPDQRASGRSAGEYCSLGVAERYDAMDWARWVKVRSGENEGVVLWGIGMGADEAIAGCEDEDFPDNIIGIISDSSYRGPTEYTAKLLSSCHLPAFLFGNVIELWVMQKGRFSMRGGDILVSIKAAPCPFLFIHGKKDAVESPKTAEFAAKNCPAPNTLLLVPDAPHSLCWITDPEKYKNAVLTFLDSLEGPPSPERAKRAEDRAALAAEAQAAAEESEAAAETAEPSAEPEDSGAEDWTDDSDDAENWTGDSDPDADAESWTGE